LTALKVFKVQPVQLVLTQRLPDLLDLRDNLEQPDLPEHKALSDRQVHKEIKEYRVFKESKAMLVLQGRKEFKVFKA
jgi:hypothetical protein